MAVFASACRDRGNQGVLQAMAKFRALTAVVKRVFAKNFRQTVTGGLSKQVNSEVAGYALAVRSGATTPLWRCSIGLLNSGR